MHWRTRLAQPQSLAPAGFTSLAVPTYRGSTVLFAKQADVIDHWKQDEAGYSYGLYGTPTALELAARILRPAPRALMPWCRTACTGPTRRCPRGF
jgi:cysteine-S-conjugate beta-lyase